MTLFDLPPFDQPAVRVLPVMWDATTSRARGTAECWPLVLEESWQVDLDDEETGDAWRAGIVAEEPLPVRNPRDQGVDAVNAASDARDTLVESWTLRQLSKGVIPVIFGGDHSVPLGAIRAARPGGILHVDAHADLRVAYEGYTGSHASILHRVLEFHEGPVVHVGLRDLCREERGRLREDPRLHAFTDRDLARATLDGTPWTSLVARMLAPLPERVWVTFDVDGLEPSLCPNTGTPVPGGLGWNPTLDLLDALARTRRIIGFDICETGAHPWDANVGARLLYGLACRAIRSQGR